MINFDSLTLKALLYEIRPILENARIQKIRQPSKQELLITLRNNSKNHVLFISIKPSFVHMCLLEDEYKKYRVIDIPQSPPMFCMLLRKYLENSRIEKIVQPEHERVVEFYFTAYGELGEKIPLVLAVELMGKHSNMILYNSSNSLILGCAHNVGEDKSKYRELAGNLSYVYPPKIYKKNISDIDETTFLSLAKVINTSFQSWLNETFYDVSMPLANEVCRHCGIPLEDTKCILNNDVLLSAYKFLKNVVNLGCIVPSIDENIEKFSIIGTYNNKIATTNKMIDLYFGFNSYNEMIYRKKKSLLALINTELKKINKLQQKLQIGDELEKKILMYKQKADTLMANLHLDCKKSDKIELQNIYTNDKFIIELDNTLSMSDNAQNYYKMYTKAKRTKDSNEQLYEKYLIKQEYINQIKSSINLADRLDILQEIEEEISDFSNKPCLKKSKNNKDRVNIEQISLDNFLIYIGKNNKQNDYIVSKLSKPDDFWFHVHNDFGSHVLVHCPDKLENLPNDIILEAAKMAAKYSERKNDKKVNVIYTKRKYIRKPPAANLGYVTYKNEKEITVEL